MALAACLLSSPTALVTAVLIWSAIFKLGSICMVIEFVWLTLLLVAPGATTGVPGAAPGVITGGATAPPLIILSNQLGSVAPPLTILSNQLPLSSSGPFITRSNK